jgi:hypothetical protein
VEVSLFWQSRLENRTCYAFKVLFFPKAWETVREKTVTVYIGAVGSRTLKP